VPGSGTGLSVTTEPAVRPSALARAIPGSVGVKVTVNVWEASTNPLPSISRLIPCESLKTSHGPAVPLQLVRTFRPFVKCADNVMLPDMGSVAITTGISTAPKLANAVIGLLSLLASKENCDSADQTLGAHGTLRGGQCGPPS